MRMLFTEAFGIESQSNKFTELEPFKMPAAEELFKYSHVLITPKWILSMSNLSSNVTSKSKHEYLHMTTKTNVKLKETIFQLIFCYLLPPFCFGIFAGSFTY